MSQQEQDRKKTKEKQIIAFQRPQWKPFEAARKKAQQNTHIQLTSHMLAVPAISPTTQAS